MPTAQSLPNWLLLILIQHGWEDPEWGKRPVDQVVLASAIHELSGKLTGASGGAVQSAAAKAVSEAAHGMR